VPADAVDDPLVVGGGIGVADGDVRLGPQRLSPGGAEQVRKGDGPECAEVVDLVVAEHGSSPASPGRLQEHRLPAPQTSRNAPDHRRRRRRHQRPALRKGQQPVGSQVQRPAHSDANRLTSPKMILVTCKKGRTPST
jgi:hypothetical protein